MRKIITIDQALPGMMVTAVTEQNGPVKIRKVGMIRSPEMIKGLTEMGVIALEVDFDQSVGVGEGDDHGLILSTSEAGQHNTQDVAYAELTPTQQLMKNDKAVATADRDLSQQFHRSMFMPSADSLPSTWHLYGKNIAIMALLLVGGLCVGLNIAQVPTWIALLSDKPALNLPEVQSTTVAAKSTSDIKIDDDNNTVGAPGQNPENATTQNVQSASQNTQTLAASNSMLNEAPNEVQASDQVASKDSKGLVSDASGDNSKSVQPNVVAQQPIILGYQSEQDLAAIRNNQIQTDSIANTDEQPQISAELMAKFNAAIAELDAQPSNISNDDDADEYDDVPRVDQLSVALLTNLPEMKFSAHMYASTPANRWVRVNGLRLVEGDYIADDLIIVNIEPQRVILSFKDEVFSMNALTDW